MTSRLFPHTCDVKRSTAVGTNGRKAKTTVATGQKCLIVPMSSRQELENSFSVGSACDVYFIDASADVRTGDQLTSGSKTYNVRAVAQYNVSRVGHLHAIATREAA